MSVNYGSKRTVVGAHYGLRDWLSQRVTGGLMALFTVVLLVQLVFQGPHRLRPVGRHFASPMDEGADLLRDRGAGLARLGRHARHLDGLHQARGLRLVLQVFTIVWLVGCAGWGIQVLWRLSDSRD
jgi:succinate dehydrogenase / fumarate reductase membrane anchor subunit